ncbi:HAD family hydrolase [Gulosibacter molinativorax]|uniref:Cof-type HAD-IIB family hydrolase n=1 Tax=Gulosibacter molinativorax TaxID=256821 RepID=A0ABT7C677_9MICO|nr:HAD family hydrolase [Gulosibacter molinativorax]MDJ1370685.1 Cof-type HAD-IIB family hydrolase [Gulosibacter molinativorax]QUY63288.1 Sugar phosphatase YidA [Gulosibacter molinativorax]
MTTDRMLIALDIDGTILDVDGEIPDATHREIDRLVTAGHEVMLATGRSARDTLPVRERLGIEPQYVVSANGAMTLEKEPADARGYTARWVETFDPTGALEALSTVLKDARFAVEGSDGVYRYSGRFPEGTFEAQGLEVPFEELAKEPVTRLVVVSPDQTIEEFLEQIAESGLHSVSYSVGWTAWLDIAPEGVNKGTALERVRESHGIDRKNVFVAGDGRNDIEMLRWAAEGGGHGVAMGNAPQEVIDAGNAMTTDFYHEGLARALAKIPS